MGRTIGAVLAGAAVWAVLWIGGNAALAGAMPDVVVVGERLEHVGALVFLIAYSGGLSVLAGFTTAKVRGEGAMRAVWALASLQMALGLFFEITSWSLLPVWYHVVFLALIIPLTVAGGRLGGAA